MVVEQNFERRLKPKIMLILDAVKNPLRNHILLDLADDEKRKQNLVDSGKFTVHEVEKIEIAQDLEPGSYDIDIAAIRDNYLFAGTEELHEPKKKKGLLGMLGFGRDWD